MRRRSKSSRWRRGRLCLASGYRVGLNAFSNQFDIANFKMELGYVVKVKIAELKDHLSRYLRQVRDTGEAITIYDRDKPVALISAVANEPAKEDPEWDRHRQELEGKARRLGIELRVPKERPPLMSDVVGEPQPAPDGRTDIVTVDFVRGDKDY